MEKLANIVIVDDNTKNKSMNNELIDFAEQLTDNYVLERNKGQVFTPKEVALFMAQMFEIKGHSLRILDPGAGLGMLSAAFCQILLNKNGPFDVIIDAYETDSNIIPYLKNVLDKCKQTLEEKGNRFNYNIIEKDFITSNSERLDDNVLFRDESSKKYDYVISNPPYFKLNKNSLHSKIMKELVAGQPNVYPFFMALSLKMLSSNGQMVFITPRSFCSGLYFKRFRNWLIKNGSIERIHLFESRADIFDDVLQENIIIKLTNEKQKECVFVSKSRDKSLDDLTEIKIKYNELMHSKNGDNVIKIPTTNEEIRVQRILNGWNRSLNSLGLKVSTGPVVTFRATKYLSPEYQNKIKTAPLLWMHNVQNIDVIWPISKGNKEHAIKICKEDEGLLLKNNNYVLVKRFSSKEQKKRLHAGVLLKSSINANKVGIENHLNYIYRNMGTLTAEEAFGIAAILNSSIMDVFFRMLNGNTQVNATDINNMPFPDIESIKKIGKIVQESRPRIGEELDKIVYNMLKVDESTLYETN